MLKVIFVWNISWSHQYFLTYDQRYILLSFFLIFLLLFSFEGGTPQVEKFWFLVTFQRSSVCSTNYTKIQFCDIFSNFFFYSWSIRLTGFHFKNVIGCINPPVWAMWPKWILKYYQWWQSLGTGGKTALLKVTVECHFLLIRYGKKELSGLLKDFRGRGSSLRGQSSSGISWDL